MILHSSRDSIELRTTVGTACPDLLAKFARLVTVLPMLSRPKCPLCHSGGATKQFISEGREFFECAICDLLFVGSSHFLTKEEEKKRYDCHENDSSDQRYRTFLSRIKVPLTPKLSPGMNGLDFGCGASDAMARIFQESGFSMERYDPIYGPQLSKASSKFDFITCSEVVEHFRAPAREFELMHSLLREGGWLAVMTNIRDEYRSDSTWWYLRDRTHICFYAEQTFNWIGNAMGFRVELGAANVVLLQKIVPSCL